MRKWIEEDWQFSVEAVLGEAKDCRVGIEKGDVFTFEYACPGGFCPRAMADIHTWCEVIRCGGDFTFRGSKEKYAMEIDCPCGCIRFRLSAHPINRDEQGNDIDGNIRPE